MSTEENRKIILEFLNALRKGDVTVIYDAFTDDSTMTINSNLPKPFGGTFRGRKEIVEGFQQRSMRIVPDDNLFEICNVIAGGTSVALEWTKRATFTTETIPHRNYTAFFEVQNAKIQTLHVYIDT